LGVLYNQVQLLKYIKKTKNNMLISLSNLEKIIIARIIIAILNL